MPETSPPSRPVRVVIVDDTRTIRLMIRALLGRSKHIEVVGEASDPYEARELIRALDPDVITLDVVMPRMSGISFLDRLMRLRPMPVVMVSSRTTENSREAIKALSLGAVDCVDLAMLKRGETDIDLAETVLMAAESNPGNYVRPATPATPSEAPEKLDWNGRAVVIGSSTGGVDALSTVLSAYPPDGPPTVIAQHMPASFLKAFGARLDKVSAPRVQLAEHGAQMAPGNVYLAPGGNMHATLAKHDPMQLQLVKHDGTETYVPSVNLLFASAVEHGPRMVGVMLTGMGRDGAKAMLRMREAGAHTIVQDSASAVVDGMPKSARGIGAAVEVVSLGEIGGHIIRNVSRSKQDNFA